MSSIFNFYPELKKFIPYNKKFLTDNFNKTFKDTQTLSYSNKSNLEDYEDFKKKIFNNIGSKYLPIMRISDGEMLFLTNFQNESRRSTLYKRLTIFVKNIIKSIIYGEDKLISSHIFGNFDHKTGTSETYFFSRKKLSKKEIKNLKISFLNYLKNIADCGILGIHYSYSNNPSIVEKYWLKFNKILNNYKIKLNENNCYPFYFIYMFLSEEVMLKKAVINNNILCVSSAEGSKRQNIINKLYNFKPQNVDWLSIPTSKTFFYKFDFKKIDLKKYDLIFLAAGTGKANIIEQLKIFNCPIIDCGYIFEVWNDDRLKYNRIGCVADNEYRDRV